MRHHGWLWVIIEEKALEREGGKQQVLYPTKMFDIITEQWTVVNKIPVPAERSAN